MLTNPFGKAPVSFLLIMVSISCLALHDLWFYFRWAKLARQNAEESGIMTPTRTLQPFAKLAICMFLFCNLDYFRDVSYHDR